MISSSISWTCKSTWKKAKINTLWCLLGCSIGDFGTILFFQYTSYNLPVEQIMVLAIINGLITSIILETIILSFTQTFLSAFKDRYRNVSYKYGRYGIGNEFG